MKGDIPSTPLLYTRPPFCNDLCDEDDDDSDDDVDDEDDDDDDEVGVSYNRQRVDAGWDTPLERRRYRLR